MIGIVAIVLSLLAGSYFRKSALAAQMTSLSRVIEVATQEMQQRLGEHSVELGMKLAHSEKLVSAFEEAVDTGNNNRLVELLDDPFISGFVGFSDINLVKLRVYSPALEFVGESRTGLQDIEQKLPDYLADILRNRSRKDRLKAVDAHGDAREYLQVEYVLFTPDNQPAFRIVGLEDVAILSTEMARIRTVSVSGFLVLVLATLLMALWLFSRFMLSPVSAMIRNMREMAQGKLDMVVENRALREFHLLADAFNTMARQVRMRTNDLERLLDLDDSAILCFDRDREMVYFNQSAATLFGYSDDEISDMDLADLFVDDVTALTARLEGTAGRRQEDTLHVVLTCRHKDGHEFRCDSVINAIDVMGQRGHAIVLNNEAGDARVLSKQGERRLDVVEHSLASLMEFARSNPSLMPWLDNLGGNGGVGTAVAVDKGVVREQAVSLMNLALACWERELGKSKLDLAEESRIWPVYIDKSTPTTRTLDKYLNLENCPKNPRSKRVVDTAEFVLRHLPDETGADCQGLRQALDEFRLLLSGVKAKSRRKDG
jgi:PAS domain S-box-containing protein